MVCKYNDWTRGEEEALLNILGGTEVARKILRNDLKVTVGPQDLLRQIETVKVNGAKRFVARDHLQAANVGFRWGKFDELFLNLVEENVGDAVIAIHRLEKNSLDAPIMAVLGSRARISLCHFFGLMEKQSKGQAGPLLTDGKANIAYIVGGDGNVWAVNASWGSGYGVWDVRASSVEYPREWVAGRQVFSCDS